MNPELAKSGIDIDSVRARYLLLVNDICDIALINEEVASHVLRNARLQKAGRLDRNFSVVICKYFPQLAAQLFSQADIRLPNSDEIIDIITQHPDLFDRLSTNQRFINLIYKSNILIKLALINEAIALFIFNNSGKFRKFDKNEYTSVVGSKYENIALKILKDPAIKTYYMMTIYWF
jgi:hypothetical protein